VPARAADPIKVGFSMALAGAVAPNGKQNLLALEIWGDHSKLAEYVHSHRFSTVVGEIAFGKDGEWTKSRQFFTQFQGVAGNDLAQFRDTTHQVILWPPEYKTGSIIYPYQDAKKQPDRSAHLTVSHRMMPSRSFHLSAAAEVPRKHWHFMSQFDDLVDHHCYAWNAFIG